MAPSDLPADFNLLAGEEVVWKGRMSWKANWWLFVFGILTIWLLIGVVFIIVAVLRVISSYYVITNKRIFSKYGLIGRSVYEIRNETITGYIIRQGIIGRMLNYGDVIISTPGQIAGTTIFVGVSDPMKVRAIIEDTLSRSK